MILLMIRIAIISVEAPRRMLRSVVPSSKSSDSSSYGSPCCCFIPTSLGNVISLWSICGIGSRLRNVALLRRLCSRCGSLPCVRSHWSSRRRTRIVAVLRRLQSIVRVYGLLVCAAPDGGVLAISTRVLVLVARHSSKLTSWETCGRWSINPGDCNSSLVCCGVK